jgi:hypothetical protein
MPIFVAAEQFIHQLLQPFAHGIADRSRRAVVDLLDSRIDSAIHGEFHRRF